MTKKQCCICQMIYDEARIAAEINLGTAQKRCICHDCIELIMMGVTAKRRMENARNKDE